QGQANTTALGEYVALAGMKRLSGKLKYHAMLLREKPKKYSLTFDSDLVGVGINLPEPLSKNAEQAWPLRLKWIPEGKNAVILNVDLDNKISVSLLHDGAARSAAYFQAAAVGVNQTPPLLHSGLNVDVRYPTVDIDLWNRIIDDFSMPFPKAPSARRQPLLPDLHEFRLQANYVQLQGVEMDHVIFTAKQPEPMQWRVDISSSQTAGTLFWREAQGKVAGNIEAKFDRLALGHNAENTNSVLDSSSPDNDISKVQDYFDMPAIDLKVDRFTLYGHELGSLSVQGVNQARGELWKLNKLNLVSPSSHIKGSGVWRLNGLDRGLTLDAQADISNLGDYFDQLGYKNILQQGSGTLSGQVVWHNLPWAYKKTDLRGRIEVDFKKGRFNNVGSRSARLLKLLSLQSVKRLAAFKFDPTSLLKDGFPFDNLRGTILVNKGIVTTDNYRVVGPLGTVVIGGNVDLSSEQLNLQAVVVPNLDVSGAAIAAGIAINPIVGIGAFLTQWLLQAPLAKAMTAQYHISGNWDDPKVKEVAHVQETEKAQPGQAEKPDLPLAAELQR
ncbi:MAG: AsmA-like C-terminal region-containing protein, partial [Burkholderiaceae bacterium]